MRDLSYTVDDKKFSLPSKLVTNQNLTDESIRKIKLLQSIRFLIFELLKTLDPSDKVQLKFIKFFGKTVCTMIEFCLQHFWGFNRNSSYHRFWDIPYCSCPKLDNLDRIGIKNKVIDKECILHGEKL